MFITYGDIGDRIAKGVEITDEIINYTSPTHTRETSDILTWLIYPIKNHMTEEGQSFIRNQPNAL